MPHKRPDLRLDVPTLEPSDEMVYRLAVAARASSSTVATERRRHRVLVGVAAFLGITAVSVGGAWAVGAIDVPGVPPSPLRGSVVTPDSPGPQDNRGGVSGGGTATGDAGAGAVAPESGGAPSGREAGAPARDDEPGSVPNDRATDPPAKDPGQDRGRGRGQENDRDRGQGESRSEAKDENGQRRGQDKDKGEKNDDRGDRGLAGEQDRQRGEKTGRAPQRPVPPERPTRERGAVDD